MILQQLLHLAIFPQDWIPLEDVVSLRRCHRLLRKARYPIHRLLLTNELTLRLFAQGVFSHVQHLSVRFLTCMRLCVIYVPLKYIRLVVEGLAYHPRLQSIQLDSQHHLISPSGLQWIFRVISKDALRTVRFRNAHVPIEKLTLLGNLRYLEIMNCVSVSIQAFIEILPSMGNLRQLKILSLACESLHQMDAFGQALCENTPCLQELHIRPPWLFMTDEAQFVRMLIKGLSRIPSFQKLCVSTHQLHQSDIPTCPFQVTFL